MHTRRAAAECAQVRYQDIVEQFDAIIVAHERRWSSVREQTLDNLDVLTETTLMCGRPAPRRPDVFAANGAKYFPLSEVDKGNLRQCIHRLGAQGSNLSDWVERQCRYWLDGLTISPHVLVKTPRTSMIGAGSECHFRTTADLISGCYTPTHISHRALETPARRI